MQVTTAMLADAAAVLDSKLYVHGGGWDQVVVAAAGPLVQPSMALAFTLRVEYSEALLNIPISVVLSDEDDTVQLAQFAGTLNVGHAPGSRRGAPIFVHHAMTLTQVTFPQPGGYHFRIATGDEDLTSVPFFVAALPTDPAPQ